jgi:hypothetical protein
VLDLLKHFLGVLDGTIIPVGQETIIEEILLEVIMKVSEIVRVMVGLYLVLDLDL